MLIDDIHSEKKNKWYKNIFPVQSTCIKLPNIVEYTFILIIPSLVTKKNGRFKVIMKEISSHTLQIVLTNYNFCFVTNFCIATRKAIEDAIVAIKKYIVMHVCTEYA